LAGANALAAASVGKLGDAFVVRAGATKHGPNGKWRKEQYVQVAIMAYYPGGSLPTELNHARLTDAINVRLRDDPAFATFREKYPRCWKVTRPAVIAALRMLRHANP